MSRASRALTPSSGIAVCGSIAFGWRSQAARLSGVLASPRGSRPRRAMPASGGPTWRAEPTTPGMVWQALQAYW